MALPTSHLKLTDIIAILGEGSTLVDCCTSTKVNKFGLNPTYCPGVDEDGRLLNLQTDKIQSYFKGYDPPSWDIGNLVLDGNFLISGWDLFPSGLSIKPDGTKLFMVGSGNDKVYEFNLSTAWDITTLSFVQSYTISPSDAVPQDIWFKPDGTKMYIINNDGIFQYSLSTPFSVISGVTYDYGFFINRVNSISGLYFKPDGTSLFISDFFNSENKILEYILSTPWDLFTAPFFSGASNFKIIDSQNNSGLFFKSDGSLLYTTRYDNGTSSHIYQFTM